MQSIVQEITFVLIILDKGEVKMKKREKRNIQGVREYVSIMAYCLIVLFLLSSVVTNGASAETHRPEIKFPELRSWVNDYVGVLTQEQWQDLNSILKSFEEETTTQIFVGILDKLPAGISLENYALELFNEHWRPGQKDVNNGVILLIFMGDRKLRISVGYGFEEILTDETCKEIIDKEIVPHFRQSNYYLGIKLALNRMIQIIEESS